MTIVCLAVFCIQAFCQTGGDTVKVRLKIKELRNVEANLKKRIETEDKKRNLTINGVSEESMSEMNERQDSLCLSLRSLLVDTRLQIKELETSITPTTGLTPEQAAANLHQGLGAILSAANGNVPAKPDKPSKPQKIGSKKKK